MDLDALGAVTLPDVIGTPHRLGAYWTAQPAVLVFLRHFG